MLYGEDENNNDRRKMTLEKKRVQYRCTVDRIFFCYIMIYIALTSLAALTIPPQPTRHPFLPA
jgi:hypothetical protein